MRTTHLIALTLTFAAVVACATVPYTNRTQLALVSEGQVQELGDQAYQQIMQKNRLSGNRQWQALIDRVGRRLAAHAENAAVNWRFDVLEGEEINAFALSGGNIAAYEGMMPVAGNEAGLAVVISHEIGHLVADHLRERISQQMGLDLVGQVLSAGMDGVDPLTEQSVLQVFGIGAQVGVLLPFSRTQESEADHIGLILMEKAGYDLDEAVNFWERMEAASKTGGLPPFLSTHPGHAERIDQIRKWIPQVRNKYSGGTGKYRVD